MITPRIAITANGALVSKDKALHLLAWTDSDLDSLGSALETTYSDPSLAWRLYGKETVDELLEFITSAHDLSTGFFWSVCKEEKPVGFIGVRHYMDGPGTLATGTYLAQEARGGIVNRAIKDLVARASAYVHAPLISSISTENPRSNRAAHKIAGISAAEPELVWETIAGRFAYIYPFPNRFDCESAYWTEETVQRCSKEIALLVRTLQRADAEEPPSHLQELHDVLAEEEDPFHMEPEGPCQED